jgi:hypothetical protein
LTVLILSFAIFSNARWHLLLFTPSDVVRRN